MWPSIWRELHLKVYIYKHFILLLFAKRKQSYSNWNDQKFRWIRECPTTSKCCPTCKAKATKNDLRKLYAKRVVVLDKTEEYRLKKLCDEERAKNADLQTSLSAIKLELAVCKGERAHFESQLNQLRKNGTYLEAPHSSSHQNTMYKLSLHKNIDISQGGCRVMTYGRRIQTLILSTKSTNTLFPGYGVRFVSAYNFQPTVFFRMSQKEIRDLSLDKDEELLAAASQDVSAFVYSVTNNTPVVTITPPSSTKVWSTSFDKNRPRYLHLGTAQGTYVYDVRNCISYVQHLTTPNDYSAVIRIQSVPISNDFRFGGFIVCKLKSLWFYEYTSSERIEQTRLMVEASFSSINFDEHTNTLFIETRTSSKNPHSRLIVANLLKIDQSTVLKVVCEIKGSTLQPQMLRGTQINIGNDSLISNYLQDTKTLGLWNAKTSFKMYGFNVDDCILDLCPMTVNNSSYLAGLSENKCRIFQINSI